MPVPCFLLFFISEILLRKYSRNQTKSITPSIKYRGDHGVQRAPGADPLGAHTTLGRGLGWAHTELWRGGPPWPATPPLRAYIPRVVKTLVRSQIFHEKFRRGRHRQSQIRGVLKLFPAPWQRGDHHRRLLHRHACLRSDA